MVNKGLLIIIINFIHPHSMTQREWAERVINLIIETNDETTLDTHTEEQGKGRCGMEEGPRM